MKKKILLFGTGEGARKYLEKHSKEVDVIAVIDNNKNSWGKLFNNTYHIYAPTEIKNFEYEQIVIASLFWGKDIYMQLVNEIKIPSEKIYLPKKSSLKDVDYPFEDKKTIELAREIIEKLSKSAIKDDIPLLVNFGTLLGLVRADDIIPWDDDIDFSVINLKNDFNLTNWLYETIKNMNLSIQMVLKSKFIGNKFVGCSLNFKNKEYQYRHFSISVSLQETKGEYSIHQFGLGVGYAPKKHFEDYEFIYWKKKECKIYAPYDYINYLEFIYGKDWQTPKKDLSIADYEHVATTNYEDLKNVIIKEREVL